MIEGINLRMENILYVYNLDQRLKDPDTFCDVLSNAPGIEDAEYGSLTVDHSTTKERLLEIIEGAFHLTGGWAKDNEDAAQPSHASTPEGEPNSGAYVSGFKEANI